MSARRDERERREDDRPRLRGGSDGEQRDGEPGAAPHDRGDRARRGCERDRVVEVRGADRDVAPDRSEGHHAERGCTR
jgi:hypothetical protein